MLRLGSRIYYGWVVLAAAALAMVGTLPGRTQGLGLITEPLLRDPASIGWAGPRSTTERHDISHVDKGRR